MPAARYAMRALLSLKPRRLAWTVLLLAALLLQPARAQVSPAPPSGPPPGAPAAAPAVAASDDTASPPRIFLPPPMRWDQAMANMRPALSQGRSDFTAITGGIAFGMQPEDVGAQLSKRDAAMTWGAMPQAQEYPGDVRYFFVPFNDAGPLKAGTQRCAGDGSYVVFLFNQSALFRISYRLIPDAACPSVTETARDIFGRYITLGETVTLTSRYRTGSAEVVDITDPGASFLIPVRWYQVGK